LKAEGIMRSEQESSRFRSCPVGLRLAVVEAGRMVGGQAAGKPGNSDAARADRQAVNAAVQALAARKLSRGWAAKRQTELTNEISAAGRPDLPQKSGGGESVSQPPLKDKAFLTFLDQTPRIELPAENGFRLRQKPVPPNGPSSTTLPSSDETLGRFAVRPFRRGLALAEAISASIRSSTYEGGSSIAQA
jgi:hypothetical protein